MRNGIEGAKLFNDRIDADIECKPHWVLRDEARSGVGFKIAPEISPCHSVPPHEGGFILFGKAPYTNFLNSNYRKFYGY